MLLFLLALQAIQLSTVRQAIAVQQLYPALQAKQLLINLQALTVWQVGWLQALPLPPPLSQVGYVVVLLALVASLEVIAPYMPPLLGLLHNMYWSVAKFH